MLAGLIEKHGLKAPRHLGTKSLVVCGADGYRDMLKKTAGRRGIKQADGSAPSIAHLFKQGSAIATLQYLKTIGHRKQSEAAVDEDDDESEKAYENNEEYGSLSTESRGSMDAEFPRRRPARIASRGRLPPSARTSATSVGEVSLPRSPIVSAHQNRGFSIGEKSGDETESPVEVPLMTTTEPEPHKRKGAQLIAAPTPSPITVPDDDETPSPAKRQKPNPEDQRIAPPATQSALEDATPSLFPLGPRTASCTPSILSSRLQKVSRDAIDKELSDIWIGVQSTVRKILNSTHVEANESANCVMNPTNELKSLYQRLFGLDWKHRVLAVQGNSSLNNRDAMEGCMSAAVFEWVINKKVPWEGPEVLLGGLSQDQGYFDQLMRALSIDLPLDTAVWLVARIKILDPEFERGTVKPVADDLAASFMLTIRGQLDAMGAKVLAGDQSSGQFRTQPSDELESVFRKALRLKGELQVAPDYYRSEWVASGAELDKACMAELHVSEGRQEVTWCVSPLVKVRATKDSQWQVACLAKVFSRPMPE